MAYHISNLGSFGGAPADPEAPAYYADRDGFVPQLGDKVEDFTSQSGQPYDPDYVDGNSRSWAEWVAAAEAATAKAEIAAAQA